MRRFLCTERHVYKSFRRLNSLENTIKVLWTVLNVVDGA